MASTQNPIDPNAARAAPTGLGRLAAWCYDHRRLVLLGWVLAVVAIAALAQWAGSRLDHDGLAATARVITAAAAIMVCVFGSFVIGDPLRILSVFGLGLAVAVLVDATVVRMVLVPAVMQLLGPANWWLPSWLGRATPRLAIEPTADYPADRGLAYSRRR